MKRNFIFALIFTFLFLLLKSEPAKSTVIIRMSFDQIVRGAELIFEGQVLSKATRLSNLNGRPFTYFTLEIIDAIKGSFPKSTIEIGYMGGRIGDLTLDVSDMRMLEVGETGIYFLESLSTQQIHPLIGWQQGHYRVITDPQTNQEKVVPVQAEHEHMDTRSLMLRQGTNLEDFKQNIRNVMGGDK